MNQLTQVLDHATKLAPLATLAQRRCRPDGRNGALTFVVTNAGHFADVQAWALQNGRFRQFSDIIFRLLADALSYSMPQPAVGDFSAKEGQDICLKLFLDCLGSHAKDSLDFTFVIEGAGGQILLGGGVVYDHDAKVWGIHT